MYSTCVQSVHRSSDTQPTMPRRVAGPFSFSWWMYSRTKSRLVTHGVCERTDLLEAGHDEARV